jgi:hypothetical protein
VIVSRRDLLLALAVYVLLTVVFTWPLALHLRHEVPMTRPAADAVQSLYAVTWGAQALGNDPLHLFQATFFYPYSASLSFLDHMFGLAVLAAPLNWATGNMFVGFNVVWLLTFVLSGLGAFLLARYLTDSTPAALLAGVLFAFHPFRYHSAGQINVLAVMWIPFALLSLHLWVETRLRREFFLFLAFSLAQFLSSAYSGVFLFIAAVLYLVVLLITDRASILDLLAEQRWVILTAAAIGLIVVAPFATPYLHNLGGEIGFRRWLGVAPLFSATFHDLLTPAAGSLLHGLTPWREAARHPLFPGVVALALALFWAAHRGWRRHPHRPEMIFYTSLTVIALVLALGPTLGGPGHRVPMPFALVHYVIPGAAFIRAPVRFITLASLGLAILAAGGLSLLLGPAGRRRVLGFAAVGVAAVELFAAPVQLLNPLPQGIPAVYRWLGSVDGQLAVLELPMPATDSDKDVYFSRYQLYSLVHKKRLANGVAAFTPPITRKLRTEMQHFPNSNSVAMLRELGISYVLIHTDHYPPAQVDRLRRGILDNPGLVMGKPDGPIWVIDVVPPGAPGSRLPG